MIGRTILITAGVDSCPSGSGNEPSRQRPPSRGREQRWVVGQFGELVAQLPPALECVNDACGERHRAGWVFDHRLDG
jgi:hypothetical protein